MSFLGVGNLNNNQKKWLTDRGKGWGRGGRRDGEFKVEIKGGIKVIW